MCHLYEVKSLGFELRVNGIAIPKVGLRTQRDRLGEHDLVIGDPCLGEFAIHDRFDIKLKTEPGKGWRDVCVREVTQAILSRLETVDSESLPMASDRVERSLLPDSLPSEPSSIKLEPLLCAEDPIRRAILTLYQANIPYLIQQPAAGRDTSSEVTVIWVPMVLKSRIRLRRAGFHQDPRWRAVLLDAETGIRIELVERPCAG